MALRCLKASLNADCDGQMGLLDLAGNATLLYYMSEEAQEGKKAFLEKRKPDFSKFPRLPNGMKSWILAFRPKTLTAAFVPILVATALAWSAVGRALNWPLGLLALASALCIQIGTNLVNDAVDFKKGTDTPARLGPTRVTQSGLLSANKVLAAAAIFFVFALLFGLPLVQFGGLPLLAIGLLSILCGYLYTGGPYPLAYYGWGDVFVICIFLASWP